MNFSRINSCIRILNAKKGPENPSLFISDIPKVLSWTDEDNMFVILCNKRDRPAM